MAGNGHGYEERAVLKEQAGAETVGMKNRKVFHASPPELKKVSSGSSPE